MCTHFLVLGGLHFIAFENNTRTVNRLHPSQNIMWKEEKKQKYKCTYLHYGRLPLIPDRLIGLCLITATSESTVCAIWIKFRTQMKKIYFNV